MTVTGIAYLATGCGSIAPTTAEPERAAADAGTSTSTSSGGDQASDSGAGDAVVPERKPETDVKTMTSDGGVCEAGTSPAPTVASGGTITPRPVGTVLRIDLVYRGTSVAIQAIKGVDKIISPTEGPFSPGKNSGYWVEVRDSSGSALYTRGFFDPTRLEAPGGPSGGFMNFTIPECDAKPIHLDVPNDARAATIVIFGDGYSTTGFARELGHFQL